MHSEEEAYHGSDGRQRQMERKRIVIDCSYTVYDDEWQDLRDLINKILSSSKYANMNAAIEKVDD